MLHRSGSMGKIILFHLYLKGKKGPYQAPLVPLVLPVLKGHQASLEYPAFLEAMWWGLQDPQDPPGHKDLQAHKAQQV